MSAITWESHHGSCREAVDSRVRDTARGHEIKNTSHCSTTREGHFYWYTDTQLGEARLSLPGAAPQVPEYVRRHTLKMYTGKLNSGTCKTKTNITSGNSSGTLPVYPTTLASPISISTLGAFQA
eukprot:1345928-Rhodomonas_salina.1